MAGREEEGTNGGTEEIDPVPEDDEVPTTPRRRNNQRPSALVRSGQKTSTGRKRRHGSSTSLPRESGEESDIGPRMKRARRADESPEPSDRVRDKDPACSRPAGPNGSVPGKSNGMNGGMHSDEHLSNMATVDVDVEDEGKGKGIGPTIQLPRAPEVDRLRLPSQRTPGKKIKETAKFRDDSDLIRLVRPSQDLDKYETPLQRQRSSPQREQSEDDEEIPVNGDNGSLQEHLQNLLPEHPEEEEETQLDEGPSPRRFPVLNPFRNMFSPQRVERPVGYEEEEMASTAAKRSVFQTTSFWFLAVLVLKAFYMDYWINPILHSVVVGSKSLTGLYREILATVPTVVLPDENATTTQMPYLPHGVNQTLFEEKLRIREQNQPIFEQNVVTEQENVRRQKKNSDLKLQIARIAALNKNTKIKNEELAEEATMLTASQQTLEEKKAYLIESNDQLQITLRSLFDDFQRERETLDRVMAQVASNHDEAAHKIATTETLLRERLEQMENLSQMFTSIIEERNLALIKPARELMPGSEDMFLTLFHIDLWEPSTVPSCSSTPITVVRPKKKRVRPLGLPVETVNALIDQFLSEVIEECDTSEHDEELITSIQHLIFEAADHFPMAELVANAPKPATRVTRGPSLDEIRTVVSERLQVHRADHTGRFDYASIHNGAHILHHATSPSLVDNLPVFNRLAAMLSLHSYGYGPEAALTPTWPEGALGQCWAFERDSVGNRLGLFADLTVAFGEPIHVESVSIEHPPLEITDNSKTAIKSFKVIGYEDPGATGLAWPLGSFTYDLLDRRKHSRQEFRIPQKLVGQDVPMLQAITLAIDSNWGEPVSCLYRFRVHGSTSGSDQ